MDRLAERLIEILNEQDFCFNSQEMRDVEKALARLAAYEDTGLTPEEVRVIVDFQKNKVIPEEVTLFGKSLSHWKEIDDAEADGRLIVLPCKVWDTVWKIVRHRVDVSGYRMEWEWETCIGAVKFSIGMFEAIGKTIFLTREEAEAALKESHNGE